MTTSPENGQDVPPENITVRMKALRLHVVSTGGNGRFILGHKYHYVSQTYHEAALAKARAEAFEEAANFLYTTNSSDEQHDLVDEWARDLRALAKAARVEAGGETK